MSIKKYTFLSLFLFAFNAIQAQNTDSLLNSLNNNPVSKQIVSTFKSTRLVLSQTTEIQKKYDLNLLIAHHFGDIGGNFGGSHTLYGLDVATDLYIGFDYGLNDQLTLGIGRSKRDELFNLFAKHRLLQQTAGNMPINLTLFAQGAIATRKPIANEFDDYNNRLSYLIQPIISRKFSSSLSLQVTPTYLIRNYSTDIQEPDNLFMLGFAGRLKLTKRFSLLADYVLINGLSRPQSLSIAQYNPLGLGLEIETGGHVFALNFMNSENINENSFLSSSNKSWKNGGVRFGFSISRNFTLVKSKNPETKTTIH